MLANPRGIEPFAVRYPRHEAIRKALGTDTTKGQMDYDHCENMDREALIQLAWDILDCHTDLRRCYCIPCSLSREMLRSLDQLAAVKEVFNR